MTKEVLLAELEDLLRTVPSRAVLRQVTPDNLSWLGRAAAVIDEWKPSHMVLVRLYLSDLQHNMAGISSKGFQNLMVLLHQARAELRRETVGPTNVAVSRAMVFDYFDELRKIIEMAKSDILFVDPYLDAEFVSNYLPHVTPGVSIRLLTRKNLPTLLPAAQMFVAQNQTTLEIRSTPDIHDRFVFINESDCYQSGASFKDGAKKAPTTITQITDAFAAMFRTYQEIWHDAKKEL